jgi:DNA-binding LacI/PurR family transcriptional regulator
MTSPTIKDVARVAGFSVATVSYVINDGPRSVTPETRARVLAAMHELGYEPNASAQRLRLNRTRVLGLAVSGLSGLPGMADLYFLDVIRGISVATDQHDYHLMLFTNAKKLRTPEFFRKLVRQRLFDGLMLMGSIFPPEVINELVNFKTPVIMIGRNQASAMLRRVHFSYEEEAYQAVQALIARGFRRVGLLLNALTLTSEQQRLAGYQRAHHEAGLPFDSALVRIADMVEIYPAREVISAYVTHAQPDVIVSAPYREVCEFLDELGYTAAQMPIVTLDEEHHFPQPERVIGAVRQPKYEVGLHAVEVLVQCINTQEPNATITLDDVPLETVMPPAPFVFLDHQQD